MNFFSRHKKIIVFIPLGLILIVLIIFGLLPAASTSTTSSPTTASSSASLQTPLITPVAVEYPYKDPANKFLISYFPDSDSYIISILASPFAAVRTQAEQAFLKQLKLTKDAACKKNVIIATPRFANPEESGKRFPLSFCAISTP